MAFLSPGYRRGTRVRSHQGRIRLDGVHGRFPGGEGGLVVGQGLVEGLLLEALLAEPHGVF